MGAVVGKQRLLQAPAWAGRVHAARVSWERLFRGALPRSWAALKSQLCTADTAALGKGSSQSKTSGEDDRRLGPCKDLYELMAFFQTPLVFFLLSHRHTSRHSAIQHAFDLCSLFQVQNPIQNLASSMNFLSVKNREQREILSLIRTTSFFCLKRKRVRKEESRIIFF